MFTLLKLATLGYLSYATKNIFLSIHTTIIADLILFTNPRCLVPPERDFTTCSQHRFLTAIIQLFGLPFSKEDLLRCLQFPSSRAHRAYLCQPNKMSCPSPQPDGCIRPIRIRSTERRIYVVHLKPTAWCREGLLAPGRLQCDACRKRHSQDIELRFKQTTTNQLKPIGPM
ncbi:uncharacterized protein LOC111254749 [Varroa destructor]|uniref:Uncharacterized protein n=1 Tax=Varroa destructor TaxID=109461 RepID=A0A7M7KZ43_VARDE|nr:uncharacterized protein LOC111254749 [Varroa destructor]